MLLQGTSIEAVLRRQAGASGRRDVGDGDVAWGIHGAWSERSPGRQGG